MNYLGNTITSSVEIGLLLYIMFKISNIKMTAKRVTSVLAVFGVSTFVIVFFIEQISIQHTVTMITAYLFTKYVYKATWKEHTILYAVATIVLVVVELIFVATIYFVIGRVMETFIEYIVCEILTAGLLVVLFKYVPMHVIYQFAEAKNKWFLTIILNLYAIFTLTTFLWYLNMEGFLESIIGIMVFVLMAIVLNIIIINNGLVNQSNKEKLQIYETYIPIIDDIIDEIRAKQHDYHNHIQTLNALYETNYSGEENPVAEYQKRMVTEDVWNVLIKLESKVIMAFLYSKYRQNAQKGIDIHFDIKSYETSSVYNDYELVEMYGIMIDNAVEGALAFNDGDTEQKRKVCVQLYKKQDIYYFETCNSSEYKSTEDIKNMFVHKYTTKKNESHGVGLTKLNSFAGMHQGMVLAEYNVCKQQMCIILKHI